MKVAHNIVFSVFMKEESQESSFESIFHAFLPVDFEAEKIKFSKKQAKTFEERSVTIIEMVLDKDRHIKVFLKNLNENLSEEQKAKLKTQADSRLDADFNFFLRLDKQSLIDRKFVLTDEGGCFHLKIGLAIFPKSKSAALKLLEEIFK